ncbi:MAG: 6-hydroxymethylpterin diphosphokinase MptE-like protein [Candidatus Algichlamydia australiensis]|nr:6-hydroxymethylpterin diphosphokinase MptE-like protein [Chlamydiales bacterium]
MSNSSTVEIHLDADFLQSLPADPTPIFKQLAWKHLFQKLSYHATLPEARALIPQLQHVVEQVHLVASDYRDLRIQTTKNLLNFISYPQEIASGETLSFSHYPAIVCGSGPSLENSFPVLQALQGKALIIGCGSSLPKLLRAGIIPTFAACIDPNPEIDPLFAEAKVPLLFQERVGQKLFQTLPGPKVYMGSSSAFPLDHYLLKAAGIKPFFLDAGWGAATFGAACAKQWGCLQIAICGVDGAEQLDRVHSRKWMENIALTPLDQITPRALPPFAVKKIKRQSPEKQMAHLRQEIMRLDALKSEPRPIFEAELSTSLLSELIFDPIWLIYKHLFLREKGEIGTHQFFFYQRLLNAYKEVLC